MGEVAVTITKWALKTTFFISVVLSVSVLIAVIASYLVIGFNTSVLNDIFALIQIWLPFNLNVLLLWLSLTATAYITYRIAILAYNLANSYLGEHK